MKRLFCLILVLAMSVCCLAACNFTQNIAGKMESDTESAPLVSEMMDALCEGQKQAALTLMHPALTESAGAAIDQMISYLSGKQTVSSKLLNINVSSSRGTSGKTLQEQLVYEIEMSNGEIIYINATYVSDKDGAGFASFQLILGAV